MRRRTALWSAAAVAVVAVLLITVLATREPAQSRIAESPLLGKPAPPVEGTTLDGTRLRLSDLRGKYVLVNFFATWCVPCQKEQPELVQFTADHRAAGDATVLAVIFDDDVEAVREFMQTRGGTWPVIDDPRGKVALEFGVRGPPESFLIDPRGFVLTRIVGEVRAVGLERLLQEARAAA